jgi:hypothetical protein
MACSRWQPPSRFLLRGFDIWIPIRTLKGGIGDD